MISAVPFRLIAIAATEPDVAEILAAARSLPGMPFGLMLRDPQHRIEVVRSLAAEAARQGVPDSVSLIANGGTVAGVGITHQTSEQISGDGGGARSGTSGFSVHSLEEAWAAVEMGADYLMFSPVFRTPSKPGVAGAGIPALRVVCRGVQLPVFALGGIDRERMTRCFDAGAYGIAGISLFHRKIDESVAEYVDRLHSIYDAVQAFGQRRL